MARFKYGDADRYGNTNTSNFFSLKDDGDVARVRFLYDSIQDVEGVAVHEVTIDGRTRYVNCLREYDDSIDKCPLCGAHKTQLAKFYIPLYDVDSGQVKLWERGKKFIGKISSLCARYPHLCSHIFEIERHGRKGDTSTTYEIYEVGHDETTLKELPSAPDVFGSIVLNKTAREMTEYLETGSFGKEGGNVVQRRDTSVRRRTPASAEDVF